MLLVIKNVHHTKIKGNIGKNKENERKIISFLFHNCLRCFRNCILAKLTKKKKNKRINGTVRIF